MKVSFCARLPIITLRRFQINPKIQVLSNKPKIHELMTVKMNGLIMKEIIYIFSFESPFQAIL